MNVHYQAILKQGSIGKAIPHAEVWVVDAGGRRCKPNQIGEIVQCGPLVTLGYWRANESATPGYARFVDAPVYSKYDGLCVYSGDLGYTDVDEYLYFFGRQDGMLKVPWKSGLAWKLISNRTEGTPLIKLADRKVCGEFDKFKPSMDGMFPFGLSCVP